MHGVTFSRRRVLSRVGGSGAVGMTGLLVAACAGGQGAKSQSLPSVRFEQPVQISFFHSRSGANGKALQDMVDTFNQTNDRKVTVKAEYQGSYPQVHEKNMVALQGGTPVEVSSAYENMVAEYMRGAAVVNLEDYVKNTTLGYTKAALDDIFPAYLEGLRFPQYDNKLLCFPFTKSLVVMYVNEEVLQRSNVTKIPQTWQEFAQAAQACARVDRALIVDQDLGAIAAPNRLRTFGWANYPSASTINAWAYSRGGSMLTADSKQAAAWLFVKWFTDRDQDVEWSITSSYMPLRKSSSEHPRLKAYWESDDPQGKQAFDLAKAARPEPNIRGTEEIRTVIQNALLQVMEGKQASKAVLDEATRTANQLLQTAG